MHKLRDALVAILICCLITSGCQTDRPTTVIEYRPQTPAVTEKAPDSQVYVLWRWYPIVPVGTQRSSPIKQHAVEVIQVYADRGSRIGFARQDHQLICVAGSTTRPLDDAHYAWRTLPGSSSQAENRRRETTNVLSFVGETIFVTIGIVVVVPLMLYAALLPDDEDNFSGGRHTRNSTGNSSHSEGKAHRAYHTVPTSQPAQH